MNVISMKPWKISLRTSLFWWSSTGQTIPKEQSARIRNVTCGEISMGIQF